MPVYIRVHGEVDDVPVIVNCLVDSPLPLNWASLCVVVPSDMVAALEDVIGVVISLNVLLPVIVSVPAPLWLSVIPE